MVLVRVSSPILYETLPSRLRGPLCTTRTCRRRCLPVAATRTLVLPALHGTSWKINDKEPEQRDDEEPQDHHQELPDLRRQNLPLCRTSNRARYTKSIVHRACIRRKKITLVSRHSDGTPMFHVSARSTDDCAAKSRSALPEGWIEDPGSPYPRVLWPQHRVVVRAFEQYLRADVERSCHRVAGLV